MPRELYDLLGVPKSADREDIRKAYLIRTRVVHPDRFNRTQQPAEWLQANDMLRELNDAYEVLSDPTKRARYDASVAEAECEPRGHHGAEEPAHRNSEPSSSASRGGPHPNSAAERFLQLCQDIRLTCWQQIQTGPGDRDARLLALSGAYTDYRRRASPWLHSILEDYRGNTPVIAQTRNAAAKCLSCLAGGFIGVDELDRAQSLALEALPLVFDDEKLEAEIKAQLDYVTAEKLKSAPTHRRNNREPQREGRSSVDFDQEVPPRPTFVAGSLLDKFGNPQIRRRLAQLAIVGIGVLGTILFFTKSNEPRTVKPGESVAHLVPGAADFERLTLDGQLDVLQRANPQQKQQLTPIFRERFNRDIDKVPEEDQELFFRKMADAGLLGIWSVEPSPARRTQKLPAVNPQAIVGYESDTSQPKAAQASPQPRDSSAPTAEPLPDGWSFEPDSLSPYKRAQKLPVVAQTPSPVSAIGPSPTPNLSNLVSSSPKPTLCSASPTTQKQRPRNGYEFPSDHAVKGHGKLTVNNGDSEDAAVILSSSAAETPDRLFYVRAGMEATIAEIPPGRYRIEFQIGANWESESFKCVLATAIFDQEAAFEEEKTETVDGIDIQYSHTQITLHKVVGGNARTTALSPSAFRRRR